MFISAADFQEIMTGAKEENNMIGDTQKGFPAGDAQR